MDSTKLADLKAEILKYPKNPNPTVSYGERRTLVVSLLDEISFLRDQDYSFAEISKILQEKTEVLIQPNTLKKYFFEELAKLKGKKTTGPKRRKASPSRSKSRSSKAAKPGDETIAEQPQSKKGKAKVEKALAEPEPEPQPEPEPEAEEEEVWGFNMDDDDDDSYTTGLVREPRFNRIRRS